MSAHPAVSFSLAGKVIVLTGGAGLFGRGLTTALATAGCGWKVALVVGGRPNSELLTQGLTRSAVDFHKI